MQGILQGWYDAPLNKTGEAQAEALGKTLVDKVFSAVFSSDLSRAFSTCSIVLGERKVTIQKAEELRERTVLEWDNQPTKRLITTIKERKTGLHPEYTREEFLAFKLFKKIESYGGMYERLKTFIQAQVTHNLGKTILLSSHGGILHSVLYTLAFKQGYSWKVPNCSYLELRAFEDGTIKLLDMHGPSQAQEPVFC
jgi:broad specificity phosphatase PhoE